MNSRIDETRARYSTKHVFFRIRHSALGHLRIVDTSDTVAPRKASESQAVFDVILGLLVQQKPAAEQFPTCLQAITKKPEQGIAIFWQNVGEH